MTIWAVDLEGRIIAANQAWSRFAVDNGAPDIAPEPAVIGCSVFDSLADDLSRTQIVQAMDALRSGSVPSVRWEFPCNSPDEERVFLMQVTALRPTPGAEVSGFVFSTVDITPSHRSREALINTGIALAEAIDVDRVYAEVARQVRRAVPSSALLIALADEESAGFRIAFQQGVDGQLEERERRLTRVWLDALATGQVVRQMTPDGLEITAPLLSSEGVLGALTLCAAPMESAQQLEEAERVLAVLAAQTAVAIERAWLVGRVEQKRRLEAIGEVAAGVAHELRNPLFGISSAAQLLQFRVANDPIVDKNVGRILREVERLNRMVTSLLEFGRPHAAHLAPADPDDIWDEILDGERARLETKGLQLRRQHADRAVACLVDAGQLGQVYRNILVNACDAAPDGSELQLVAHALPTGGWRCRLTNGGPTIPPETLSHVFEFFFSTKTGGTGIGLALCQRIMDEHGGTIGIESSADVGTTLTVTLPPAPR